MCSACSKACLRSASGSSAENAPSPTFRSSRASYSALALSACRADPGRAVLTRWNTGAFKLFKEGDYKINVERDFPAVAR